MSMNKNDRVMIALFKDEAAADQAVDELKEWDRARPDYKLGAIGKLQLVDGEIKTSVPSKAGGGAKVGILLGVMAGVLTGGIGLVAGAVGGGLLGGAAGAFFKKSLHLTPEEIAALKPDLEAGKVALVVTCDDYEMVAVDSRLQYSGGVVKSFEVPPEAMSEAARAVEEGDALGGWADTSAPG